MRSTKSRSRSKSNRNRSVGNVINRVFDSSGPEGKVRGTPQQIIDKYNQLARDAQLSNDRVSFENFQQHAEHYTRMLAEAQREQEARRELMDQQNRERQQQRREEDDQPQEHNAQREQAPRDVQAPRDPVIRDERPSGDEGARTDARDTPDEAPQAEAPTEPPRRPRGRPRKAPPSDVIETGGDDGSTLVETPESKPAPRPRRRRRASAEQPPAEGGEVTPTVTSEDSAEAAE